MNKHSHTSREIKLTAAVYATDPDLVAYVKEHGCLPDEIKSGGFPIAMSKIIEWRGINLKLKPKEKLVYDAIVKSGKLPSGAVNVVEDM